MLEQIINVLVVLPAVSAESSGTMRHLARASCGVRHVPFLEMRSLRVVRLMHVVSEVFAVAGVEVEATAGYRRDMTREREHKAIANPLIFNSPPMKDFTITDGT